MPVRNAEVHKLDKISFRDDGKPRLNEYEGQDQIISRQNAERPALVIVQYSFGRQKSLLISVLERIQEKEPGKHKEQRICHTALIEYRIVGKDHEYYRKSPQAVQLKTAPSGFVLVILGMIHRLQLKKITLCSLDVLQKIKILGIFGGKLKIRLVVDHEAQL